MSSLAWEFSPKSNAKASLVESKYCHHSPCCEFFYPNGGVLVTSDRFNCRSRSNFGWNLRQRKIAVYEENSSCCDSQKHKKKEKQHFRFLYNTTFSKLLSLSRYRRIYINVLNTKGKGHTKLIRSF